MSSNSMQLIDGNGHPTSEEELVHYLASMVRDLDLPSEDESNSNSNRSGSAAVLHNVGSSYHIVGIFGGQSSGKSTLLNLLFQTKFQTLEETVRRGQTTLGAFIARATIPEASAPLNEPLFVVDFEGTDGLEHGDNQSLDRQLSLFGLCMADTLIINMWAVDVGRFNAANLSLLRTIFEVNLHLFSHDNYAEEEKPTLLIVVRDFVDDNTEPSLTTLNKSFEMIWAGLRREGKFAHVGIDALFRLRFFFLPHYKLQQEAFGRSLVALRDMFTNPSNADYLFRHRTMFRGVPLESLPAYLTSCWSTIQASKDLDIPTQREMLAWHRCSQVQAEELTIFQTFCEQLRRQLDDGHLPSSVSGLLRAECVDRLTAYEQQTQLYSADVVGEYATTLRHALAHASMTVLQALSEDVASVVMRGVGALVHAAVAEALDEVCWAARSLPFLTEMPDEQNTVQNSAEHNGDNNADQYSNKSSDIFSMDHRNNHNKDTNNDRSVMQTQYIMNNTALHALTVQGYCRIAERMAEVRCRVAANPPAAYLYANFANLMSGDEAVRLLVAQTVEAAVYDKLHFRMRALAENAAETMQRGFERALTHNDDGGVRFFATAAGLQRAVSPALQAGLVLLDCLLYFRLRRGHDTMHIHVKDRTDDDDNVHDDFAYTHVRNEEGNIELANSAAEQRFFLHFFAVHIPPRYPYGVEVVQPRHATRAPHANQTAAGEKEDVSAHHDHDNDDDTTANDANLNTNDARHDHANQSHGDGVNSVPAHRVLLAAGAVQQAYDAFKKQCDFSTQLHMRSIESSRSRLPAWVIPALVILGWNEALFVLRSPTLLLITLSVVFLFGRGFVLTQWQVLRETAPSSIVVPIEMAIKALVSAVSSALMGTNPPASPAVAQENAELPPPPPAPSSAAAVTATNLASSPAAAVSWRKSSPPMVGVQRYFSFSHSNEMETMDEPAAATGSGVRYRGREEDAAGAATAAARVPHSGSGNKSMLVDVSHEDPHANIHRREGNRKND